MIHYTPELEVEHYPDGLKYNRHPTCCGDEMVPLILDERLGAMTLTFICASCRRYEIK